MSFDTESRTIHDIFQRSCQYTIPRYQRGYVWGETNWEELMNDVKFTMHNEKVEWSHFIGTIVLGDQKKKDKKNIQTNGLKNYEIIDGQQRLTTIYILFNVILMQLRQIDTDEATNRADYLYQTFIVSLSANSEAIVMIENEELKVYITEVVHYSNQGNMIAKDNIFFNLFNFFHNELKAYEFAALATFLTKLLDTNVVEIISHQEEEIYNIFEVLNARGQKLKQIEILKNHIMKYIQPRSDELIDETRRKWNSIVENSSHLHDTDDLLLHFCKCYIEKKQLKKEAIYKVIKKEISIYNLLDFLDALHEFSFSYKNIRSNENSNIYIEYFDIKGNKQISSLLTAIEILHKKKIITIETRELCFKNLRNFFFIFNISKHTSNTIDSMINIASYNVYNAKTNIDFKFIINDLFYKLDEKVSVDNFEEKLFTYQSIKYSNCKGSPLKKNYKLVKYILYCYYSHYQGDTFLDRKNLTIEHLYSDNGDTENALLSNLTLTTEKINSKQLSNKCIKDKIKILGEESSIKINHRLGEFLDNNNELDIKKRQEKISDNLLNEIFKFDKELFKLTQEDIEKYNGYKETYKDNEEMLNLLYEKGKDFEKKIENDPTLEHLRSELNITKEKVR